MTEINQDRVEEKINIIDNVLHYYDGCRDEGERIVERIVTAMIEDDVIEEVVTHMVAVIKLMEL